MMQLANPVSDSDSGSDAERKKVLQTIAKMGKNDLLQIRKDTQGIINTQIMPLAKEVLETRTEKAIVIAGTSVTMTLGLANFLRENVNNDAVLGMCMAMICSGYVPISEGYDDFKKDGVIKNWKWLWGDDDVGGHDS